MKILETGATGNVGRLVVNHLLGKGVEIRALTNNPAKAALPPEVDVIEGYLGRVSTLPAAQYEGFCQSSHAADGSTGVWYLESPHLGERFIVDSVDPCIIADQQDTIPVRETCPSGKLVVVDRFKRWCQFSLVLSP